MGTKETLEEKYGKKHWSNLGSKKTPKKTRAWAEVRQMGSTTKGKKSGFAAWKERDPEGFMAFQREMTKRRLEKQKKGPRVSGARSRPYYD